MDQRNAEILAERITGSTLRELGERHDLSHEGARFVLTRQARRHIDQIATAAWRAQFAGELLTLSVPAWAEHDLAAEYFAWLVGELRKRDDGFGVSTTGARRLMARSRS